VSFARTETVYEVPADSPAVGVNVADRVAESYAAYPDTGPEPDESVMTRLLGSMASPNTACGWIPVDTEVAPSAGVTLVTLGGTVSEVAKIASTQ
jgi:hypothetical protein